MSTTAVDAFLALQLRVKEATREAAKAEGALEQLMTRLKKDFKCTTIGQAKKKLKKLEAQLEEDEIAFEKGMEAFEEEWGEKTDD